MKFLESLKFAFKKYVIKSYLIVFSLILGIASVIFVFVPLNDSNSKTIALVALAVVIIITFIINFLILRNRNSVNVKINQTNVTLRYADLFDNTKFKDTYRVLGVNDYYDTHVGDGIIDEKTLHGKYLTLYNLSCEDLDARILADSNLSKEVACTTTGRAYGKNIRYNLGSTFFDNKKNFILVALSHFDENNNARLTTTELMQCYLKMWTGIARVKESNGIVLPLLGSSSNIQMDNAISSQEILETLLLSFKLSNVQLRTPATLTIVLNKNLKKELNLQRIKEIYSGE